MNPSSVQTDTDPDVFRRQVDRWRSMTPTQRQELADRLSRDVMALAVAGIHFQRPDITPTEIRYELTRRRYGSAVAEAACGSTPPV